MEIFSTTIEGTNSSYISGIPEPVSDYADSLNPGLTKYNMPILNAKKASIGFDTTCVWPELHTTSYTDMRQERQVKNGATGAISNDFSSTLDDSEDGDFCRDFLYKV